jgi:hypothetical protein
MIVDQHCHAAQANVADPMPLWVLPGPFRNAISHLASYSAGYEV